MQKQTTMKTNRTILFLFMATLMLSACQKTGNNAQKRDSPDFTLEEVAKMAYRTETINPKVAEAPGELQDKHYFRKHGANAYYG